MPRLTREEAKALGRRAQQPTLGPGELLAVWVPGKLRNMTNRRVHWRTDADYRKRWKERTALSIWEAIHGTGTVRVPRQPQRVAFMAGVHQAFDSDGLQDALKPVRDALVECGVISGDADRDGHEFVYSQVIDRARRGVEVRVSLRKDGA